MATTVSVFWCLEHFHLKYFAAHQGSAFHRDSASSLRECVSGWLRSAPPALPWGMSCSPTADHCSLASVLPSHDLPTPCVVVNGPHLSLLSSRKLAFSPFLCLISSLLASIFPSLHCPRITDSPGSFPVSHLSTLPPCLQTAISSPLVFHLSQGICSSQPQDLLEPPLVLSCQHPISCLFHVLALDRVLHVSLAQGSKRRSHPPPVLPGASGPSSSSSQHPDPGHGCPGFWACPEGLPPWPLFSSLD